MAAERMARIPGATFEMGSDRHYPEEGPVHKVTVAGFWMDLHPVTNEQFAAFVLATGYVTLAERPLDPALYPGAKPDMLKPGALVFQPPPGRVGNSVHNWWAYIIGAQWRHPEGPGSSVEGREDHPVVHVAFEDALAYADWAGKALPTEAEWELAARGGLKAATYAWGEELNPGGRWMANTWQGEFPWRNLAQDGFERTSPVGSFPANGHGLFDMTGNVWEWTRDWWAARHAPAKGGCCAANPRGGLRDGSFDPAQPRIRIPRRVVKGGSFLCAPSYCLRYRPAARQPQMIDSAMSHIGFRCVRREGRKA